MNTRLIGATLLVSGTTIGAGMLGLPVVTGPAGFIPSVILLIIYWLFMVYTAFLMLETTLWFPDHTNLVTMSKKTLGLNGQVITWIFYLFLLYALTTAYMAGCNPLFLDFFECTLGERPAEWVGYIPLLLIFGFFIYRGYAWVDHANRWMMAGMLITFILIFALLGPKVEAPLLTTRQWPKLSLGLSLIVTSFGFHIIIPSLSTYLHRNVPALKKAIVIGSIVPLIAYILWQWLNLGIIPSDHWTSALNQGLSSTSLLLETTNQPLLKGLLRTFSFFIIITSFLGVSMSLFDFLSDGLKIPKSRMGRGMLYLLTFFPPLLISLKNPHIFIKSLEYAGAFGVVVILAIIPALMVYFGREKHPKAPFKAKGGTAALMAVMFLSLIVITHEIYSSL